MEFREKGSIYVQIADYVCDQILLKKWLPDQKIPSLREFAATMQVNGITVQRSYDHLLQLGIITNKRGIGYFVDADAEEKVLALRRAQFLQQELPAFLKNLRLLKIDLDDIKAYVENTQNNMP